MYHVPQSRTTQKQQQISSQQRSRSRSFSRHKTNPSRKPVVFQTNHSNNYDYQSHQHQTDPEIRDFYIDNCNTDQSIYTHNLTIDYGKLQKPYHAINSNCFQEIQNNLKLNKLISKPREATPILLKPLPSKNVNIKQAIILQTLNTYNDNEQTGNQHYDRLGKSKMQIRTSRTKYSMQSSQKESAKKSESGNKKKSQQNLHKRTQQIDSLENKRPYVNIIQNNTQPSSYRKALSQPSSRKTIIMRLSDVRAIEKKSNTQKKLKAKMIKTIVAGGKTQIKMINYPDITDYLKLCGIKENNRKNCRNQ